MLLLISGYATLSHFRHAAHLSEGVSLLVAGEAQAAGRTLLDLTDSWSHGAQARAGLAVAQALGAQLEAPGDMPLSETALDPTPFPLAVLARNAFETGRFESTLDLMDLAEDAGKPTVDLVKTAALIEQGRHSESPPPVGWPAVRLARHVQHYLETVVPRVESDLILRDRTGQRLGYVDADGEMTLAAGVRPEWVPRAAAALGDAHQEAASLRLSLDLEISELAFDALGSYRGSIVILDPKTGQILAAVSDQRSFAEGGTPAFEERREPASIAKLITTAASLRAGYDPDAEIAAMTCNGHRVYNGVRLYCPYIARRLRGLDRAMAVSCNLAFADLGVQVGRRAMLEEHRRFGFDTLHGPFPGGRIVTAQGDDRQLADLSIGLEATNITPLHAALMAAVMGNDGVMPVPTLVHAEDGRLGFHPRRLPPVAGRKVIEPEWLPILLSAMRRVAENGTANHLAPPGFPVAMKTGTASDPRWGFHVNYIGIGPLLDASQADARLAFAIRVTHQRTSKRVRYAARRVSQRLFQGLDRLADQRGWSEDIHLSGRDRIHRLARDKSHDPESLVRAR